MGKYYQKLGAEGRFWKHVEMIPFHSCWEWIGAKDEMGYGKFHVNNKRIRSHRFSLGLVHSLDPKLVVDHVCRNRSCVNPAHLRQITAVENTMEPQSLALGSFNKKKTHCKRGHEFTPENTIANGLTSSGNKGRIWFASSSGYVRLKIAEALPLYLKALISIMFLRL